MPVVKSPLDHLSHRFPGSLDHVATLYDHDQAFRDLCEVYGICVRGVKRSQAAQSSALAAEYAAQQMRLETEVLRWLEGSRATAARPTPGE